MSADRRRLRRRLLEILRASGWRQQSIPPRLAAMQLRQCLALLPAAVDMRSPAVVAGAISRGELHRRVITIRCPDQAFYLDAVKGVLARRGVPLLAQHTIVLGMACDEHGCMLDLREPEEEGTRNFILATLHVPISAAPDGDRLVEDLRLALWGVDVSVRDFEHMARLVRRAARGLAKDDPEAAALLSWLVEDRYVFFGAATKTRRLGQLRDTRKLARLVPGLAEALRRLEPGDAPGLAWLLLPPLGAHLYAQGPVESFRVCWREGTRRMELVVIGHFARSARFANASHTPLLRRHWMRIRSLPRLRFSAFYRREARTLFDRAPKHILLATRPEDWAGPLVATVDLAAPQAIVCHHLPAIPAETSVLFVALAAARFSEELLARMLRALREIGVRVFASESYPGGAQRIVLFQVAARWADGGGWDEERLKRVHHLLTQVATTWRDRARALLLQRYARDARRVLVEIEALSPLYAELFPPEQLPMDLALRDWALAEGRARASLMRTDGHLAVRIIAPRPRPLAALVGMLERMDLLVLEEAALSLGAPPRVAALARLVCRPKSALSDAGIVHLHHAIEQVLAGEADDDPLNALIARAALDVQRVGILILLRNALVQMYPEAAPSAITDMLLRHPELAGALARWFTARHLPGATPEEEAATRKAFEKGLAHVQTLHDDRWFRALGALVAASLRTNAFARTPDVPLAVKFAPRRLAGIPEPKPWREVFVHGVEVEGVHLRAGPVARGGIRFSDRPADFRTEILELMATQVVKNGQIVPTGAKGGFVVRGEASPARVRRAYRAYIRALLSLTDQRLADGRMQPPEGVRVPEEDRDDPYLVVAADKGTARFSDDANDEATRVGFWLGDAFASGGRTGYDHKKLGITAKGAWACAAHHFTRLGRDAWRDALTVVGIGDPSGDVFGNGMLLNPNIRLIAAFNHKHIFLDPDPDPAAAHAERRRLFAAGLDWAHYDRAKISKGGGVFPRNAKRIVLSEEARRALGIRDDALSGETLIRAILTAPVDMLYNGGIGTYVKAASETHEEVRDPANNAVRVNAEDLRCKVVVEGGNLGLTQKARLVFAARGGHVNTDAVDNAAGVHISDREVNLKLLLAQAGIAGRRRDRWLARLAPEIVRTCIAANEAQARTLTLAELDIGAHRPRFARLQGRLVRARLLDAFVAAGIEEKTLHLRPALAVLLGQEKNRIRRALVRQGFDRRSAFAEDLLFGYFPVRLARRMPEAVRAHPLAAEIVAVEATNRVVNGIGLAAVSALADMTGAAEAEIVEALLVADHLLDGEALREAIWHRPAHGEIAAELHHTLSEHVLHLAEGLLRLCNLAWFRPPRLARWARSLARLAVAAMPEEGARATADRLALVRRLAEAGLSMEVATRYVSATVLAGVAPVLRVARMGGVSLARAWHAWRRLVEVVPIGEIESELRSAVWGEREAHALRGLVLARTGALKAKAIERLVRAPALAAQWQQALEEAGIPALLAEMRSMPPEARRLRALRLLEYLEGTILAASRLGGHGAGA